MKKYYDVLVRCPLFEGMEETELFGMLDCLGARTIEVSRGETVFLEGDPAEDIGILLSGAVQIVRNDYSGNRSIFWQTPGLRNCLERHLPARKSGPYR